MRKKYSILFLAFVVGIPYLVSKNYKNSLLSTFQKNSDFYADFKPTVKAITKHFSLTNPQSIERMVFESKVFQVHF